VYEDCMVRAMKRASLGNALRAADRLQGDGTGESEALLMAKTDARSVAGSRPVRNLVQSTELYAAALAPGPMR
jgi:hypothetical protein